jgi:oligopeptide/dipeptide ABC transporter ATP-binding protein
MSGMEARAAAERLLAEVGIPDPQNAMSQYAHEFSGGMCQRVGIALALCNQPRLMIADEPTSALDPTLQAQVLNLLREMKRLHDLALILISHDLALVSDFADRVIVMYLGRIVEHGSAARVFSDPAHPYTRGLLQSQPDLHHHRERKPLTPIPGIPQPSNEVFAGCPFAPRCPIADSPCMAEGPALVECSEGHWAACLKAGAGH